MEKEKQAWLRTMGKVVRLIFLIPPPPRIKPAKKQLDKAMTLLEPVSRHWGVVLLLRSGGGDSGRHLMADGSRSGALTLDPGRAWKSLRGASNPLIW